MYMSSHLGYCIFCYKQMQTKSLCHLLHNLCTSSSSFMQRNKKTYFFSPWVMQTRINLMCNIQLLDFLNKILSILLHQKITWDTNTFHHSPPRSRVVHKEYHQYIWGMLLAKATFFHQLRVSLDLSVQYIV